MDKYTNERVKSALEKMIKNLNEKFKIEKAMLFGSRAKDEWLMTSDVDILIVSDDFKEMPMQERMAKVMEFWNEDIDLEPLCYTNEEFSRKKAQIGIVSRAVKEGIKILG